MPEYVKDSNTKIAPIVSSPRCCKLIVKHWIKKYNYVPDMIVIEGPEAGGHLGFKRADNNIDKNSEQNNQNEQMSSINYTSNVDMQNSVNQSEIKTSETF